VDEIVLSGIVVFDIDGVLAEVTESYREATVRTVEHFTGRRIDRELIQDYKNQGGWNNDWALTQKIAASLGFDVPYEEVVDYFDGIFIGRTGDGLIQREQWIPRPGLLERLRERLELAIFTGRMQYEVEFTLRRFASGFPFDPVLCADHVARSKPAPDGLLAIQRMKPGRKLWYVGDTVDDARCARSAGVPFIGIAAHDNSRREELIRLFEQEGALAILENVNEVEEAL